MQHKRRTSISLELRHNLRVFWSASLGSFSNFLAEYSPAVFFGTAVPRYILQSAFFVLLARFAGGPELMRFSLLGNAVQIAANMGLVNMVSVVESEKWIGTLPLLIAVPSNKLPALIGRGVANMIEGLVGIGFALGAGMLLFGAVFVPLRLLMALPLILLVITSIFGLGLLIGAITLPLRIGTLTSNAMAYIMMVICGVNFPISGLPEWLQSITRLIPMTNGLMAVRQVVDGANYRTVLPLIGYEILVGFVCYVLGYLVFEARLRTARQRGTIELF
ncbi:MAG TPA: ABC transporter permease [Anaerolineae bacterium]|nr:ABC transporter permease [Anaerolineae bacterium]